MKAIKKWRGLRYDVPSALEIADGVECLGVGTAARGHEGGRDDRSEDGVPSEPRLKFSSAQTANMDETPVWFEAAGKSTVAASIGYVDLWIFFFFSLLSVLRLRDQVVAVVCEATGRSSFPSCPFDASSVPRGLNFFYYWNV